MTDPNHHRARTRQHAVPTANQLRNSPRATRRRRYSPDQWERRKAQIEKLYKDESRTLRETMEEMENQGFHADKNAYKRYFKRWNWTKNKTRRIPTSTTEAPDEMDDPPAHVAGSTRATASNQQSQLSKDLQKNRPFFLFREHRNINNPIFLAQAAVLSVHLRDHMELAPDQVRQMLAEFGLPQSQQSSESTADSSFFFGVLGLISNKALSGQKIERFLDIVLIERCAPRAFLEVIFAIDTPTVDAISEALLGNHHSPHLLGLLPGVSVLRRHLTGDRPWKMFCSAFHARTLDSNTGKRLLSEFWKPSMMPDRSLRAWWPSWDTENDRIAQDGDLMDRLVEIGALSLDQALSHAVRWNQCPRVSFFLERGADTNRCQMYGYVSSSMTAPHSEMTALDCAYLKGFFGVYQLLKRHENTTAGHPTINKVLAKASSGLPILSTYWNSNHSWGSQFTIPLYFAVLCHQPHLDDAIDALLDCGISPNAHQMPSSGRKSTLAHAIPNIDLVGRLLRAGANINHFSVIEAASSDSNHIECLGFLIAQGMDLAEVGSIGLSVALENGNDKAFKLLLRTGADANRRLHPALNMRTPPLSVATRKGNLEAARTLLNRGANVDIKDEKEWRPIHYAARFADLRMIKLLVQFGANFGHPEDANAGGWYAPVIDLCALRTTPYHDYFHNANLPEDGIDRPWSNEDTEIFRYLVEMGADLNSAYVGESEILRRKPVVANLILSSADNNVILFALRKGARFDGRFESFDPRDRVSGPMTPLQAAARKGNLEMVKELHGRGADINAKPSHYLGTTALQAVCDGAYDAGNRLAVVEYLLDHGADVDADAADGCKTVASAAASKGYVEITVRLLERGASVKGEASTDRTSLYYAARNGRLDAVQVLCNMIGSMRYPEQPDYTEEIKVAEEHGHWAIADLLTKAGYEPYSESESE